MLRLIILLLVALLALSSAQYGEFCLLKSFFYIKLYIIGYGYNYGYGAPMYPGYGGYGGGLLGLLIGKK